MLIFQRNADLQPNTNSERGHWLDTGSTSLPQSGRNPYIHYPTARVRGWALIYLLCWLIQKMPRQLRHLDKKCERARMYTNCACAIVVLGVRTGCSGSPHNALHSPSYTLYMYVHVLSSHARMVYMYLVWNVERSWPGFENEGRERWPRNTPWAGQDASANIKSLWDKSAKVSQL